MSVHESQSEFYSCYRQRQSWLHDHAYLRLGKTIFIEFLLRMAKVPLPNTRICDFGFGAGAFFLKCPKSARLAGIELDTAAVEEIRRRLSRLGYRHLDLHTFASLDDESLPWPDESFDLVICSHVLEHCPEPRELVRRLSRLLRPGGHLIGLVPINEIAQDPKHLIPFDETRLKSVCDIPEFHPVAYAEADEWMYWLQPVFLRSGRLARLASQALSLVMGFALCSFGPGFWSRLGSAWSVVTHARPAQAGIVLIKQ